MGEDVADVIEGGQADAIDDRDAVFRGAHVIGVAAEGLVVRVARADLRVAIATEGVGTAEEVAIEERDALAVIPGRTKAGAGVELEDVAFRETFEIPTGAEFELVERGIAPERAAGNFAGEFGLLTLVREEAAAARVIGEEAPTLETNWSPASDLSSGEAEAATRLMPMLSTV